MKYTTSLILAAIVLMVVACSQGTTDTTADVDTTAVAETPVETPVTLVTWNEIGIHATPAEKGKYVTSVYLGEHLVLAGDTASEKAGSKRNHYHKVILSDGKEGWVRDEFIGIEVFPAVVMQDAQIMKRPDVATVTEKQFMTGDFVTVKNKNGEYLEVTGKIAGDKWYTTGYVRAANLSYADVEIQYATLKRRFNEESKANVQAALLSQIDDATLFGGSVLWSYDHAETVDEGEGDGGYDEGGAEEGGDNVPLLDLNPPSEGLVGYYRLDMGDADDYSDNGNNGTIFGTLGVDNDKRGGVEGAASFDGKSYAQLGNVKLTVPFTIAAYFKVNDTDNTDQWVVSRAISPNEGGFRFGYTRDERGNPVFRTNLSLEVNARATNTDGEWVFVVVTASREALTMYINGNEVGSSNFGEDRYNAINGSLSGSSMPVEIGRDAGTRTYFRGSIDNVGIWNRALTPQEARFLMPY